MRKISILIALIALVLVSCGQSPKEYEAKAEKLELALDTLTNICNETSHLSTMFIYFLDKDGWCLNPYTKDTVRTKNIDSAFKEIFFYRSGEMEKYSNIINLKVAADVLFKDLGEPPSKYKTHYQLLTKYKFMSDTICGVALEPQKYYKLKDFSFYSGGYYNDVLDLRVKISGEMLTHCLD